MPEPEKKPEKEIEAIKLQQTWSIWLVTAQLAILGAIAVTAIGEASNAQIRNHGVYIILVIGMFFSCLSMIAASILLSAHPWMLLNITAGRSNLNLQPWNLKFFPSTLALAIIEHYSFVVAVVCYGIYLGIRILHPDSGFRSDWPSHFLSHEKQSLLVLFISPT